jgi:hypothetical protein
MKRSRAILSIAPDRRQAQILGRVMPSWERYARRYGLKIVVAHRSPSKGQHPYWDRWLSIQNDEPEVEDFDELLMLDNDIYISENAPNIFDVWDPAKINVVEESAQGPWNPKAIPDYYRSFCVEPDARLPVPTKVFNMGVCVINRQQNSLFKSLYEKWRDEIWPRFSPAQRKQRDALFHIEADGPFLSYELQAASKISALPKEFNFFIIPWLRVHRIWQLPFLLQSKAAQKLRGKMPAIIVDLISLQARRTFSRVTSECYFLHVAASKSPLWLVSPISGPHS